MFPYIVIIFLSLIGVFADFLIKLATQTTTKSSLGTFLFAGLLIYASTAFGWFYVIKHVKLSTLGVWYSLSTILLLTIISVFHFDESLSTLEIFGIVAALLSLILLARFA